MGIYSVDFTLQVCTRDHTFTFKEMRSKQKLDGTKIKRRI